MKKVIALIDEGSDAQIIAGHIAWAFGTAKNIVYRIGAADPSGKRKIAIGPIDGEANEEIMGDILDTTVGVVIHEFRECVGNLGVRGMLETELESSAMPDLPPYVPEPQPVVVEPIKTAPPQPTEPPKSEPGIESALSFKFLRFVEAYKALGDSMPMSVASATLQLLGGVQTVEIRFPDNSVLSLVGEKWEVV